MKAKAWLASPSQSGLDALNPTSASFMTYGPLHLRLGEDLVDTAHSAASYQLGSDANYAMLTRGGYCQRTPLLAQLDQARKVNGFTNQTANDQVIIDLPRPIVAMQSWAGLEVVLAMEKLQSVVKDARRQPMPVQTRWHHVRFMQHTNERIIRYDAD